MELAQVVLDRCRAFRAPTINDLRVLWHIIMPLSGPIIAVVALSIFLLYPPKDKINLGLDLKGGMHLLLEVNLDEALDNSLDRAIVEIKGYRREDAKEKKSTMDTYWVPGVNHLGTYGRWAFAEFTDVYQIQSDFAAKVAGEFNTMIAQATRST